jgi:hypothetical protein
MAVFTAVLVRGHRYELAASRYELSYRRTPPEPADGLRATVVREAWPSTVQAK